MVKAIVTDQDGYYVEPARTDGRLLVATPEPPEAPTSPVTAPSTAEARKAPTGSVMERIAFCESRDDPHAKNPKSTASGRYQILRSSWTFYGKQLWGDGFSSKDIFSYEDNTELAKYMYAKEGTAPWVSSRYCWQ